MSVLCLWPFKPSTVETLYNGSLRRLWPPTLNLLRRGEWLFFTYVIFTTCRLHCSKPPVNLVKARSYKNYDSHRFVCDLEQVPWHNVYAPDDASEMLDQFNHMFFEKLDHHALIKIVRIRIVAAHLVTWKLRNLWDVEIGCWNTLVVPRFKWTVNCTVIKIWSRLREERKVVKTKLSKRIHSERARKLPECRF